jgi:hypothetical protein
MCCDVKAFPRGDSRPVLVWMQGSLLDLHMRKQIVRSRTGVSCIGSLVIQFAHRERDDA